MKDNSSNVRYSQKKIKRSLTLIFFVLLVIVAVNYVDFNPIELVKSIPIFISFIFFDFFPLNTSDLGEYIKPVIDTLFISILATTISSILAMFLGILMAHNTTPWPICRIIVRGMVTFFRSIPFLLWASVLVVILGVGPLPGMFGLILFGTAFLARVYAESIEEIGPESLEALDSTGATYGQKIKHSVLPQFMPSFFSWTLFMFEINVRSSAILGIVGAGGVGVLIKESMDLFQYSKASTVIAIMILMILILEYLTNRIRERLI